MLIFLGRYFKEEVNHNKKQTITEKLLWGLNRNSGQQTYVETKEKRLYSHFKIFLFHGKLNDISGNQSVLFTPIANYFYQKAKEYYVSHFQS